MLGARHVSSGRFSGETGGCTGVITGPQEPITVSIDPSIYTEERTSVNKKLVERRNLPRTFAEVLDTYHLADVSCQPFSFLFECKKGLL